MLRARLRPVLALALATTACSEQPSFWVRWELGRVGATAVPVDSVDQCTELGITRIRITTLEGDATVDVRDYPCFPEGYPELPAPGPELGDGEYTVTVTALSRRGVPFKVVEIDEITKDEQVVVVASASETIAVTNAGKRPEVAFPILGVTECDDGVDNDLDGYTDLADASCETPADVERGDQAVAQVTVRPRLLGGNPSATCSGLGLSRFEVQLVGPETYTHSFECGVPSDVFTQVLTPGAYDVRVLGKNFQNQTRATIEIPGDPDITITSESEYFAAIYDVDVSLASFAEPIEAGFDFSVEYGDEETAVTACEFGALKLGPVRVTAKDQDGAVQALMLLDEAMEPLDGAAALDCAALLSNRSVAPLTWAAGATERLTLTVEAFAAEDVGLEAPCFSNSDEPTEVAPNTTVSVRAPRVRTDGLCAE